MYIRGRTPSSQPPVVLPPGAERRMSPTQQLATRRSLQVINEAGIQRPDAIFSATALGCLADTEQFLSEITAGTGTLRSPVPFMRSTHNTIAGQVALSMRVTGPNITFSQGSHGTADALLAAVMHLEQYPEETALVLVWDERAELSTRLVQALSGPMALELGKGLSALLLGGRPLPTDRACIRSILCWEADEDAAWWEMAHPAIGPATITHLAWASLPGTGTPPIQLPGALTERYDLGTAVHGARMAQAVEHMAQQMAEGTVHGPAMVLDVRGERRAAIILEPCAPTA